MVLRMTESYRLGMRLKLVKSVLVGTPVFAGAISAHATDILAPSPAPLLSPVPASGWTVTLGVEGRVLPRFEGSSDSRVLPFPLFGIRRIGEPETFRSPRDGASVALYQNGPFRAGPTGKLRLSRDESD